MDPHQVSEPLMKIVFNSWQGAFFNPGGGEVQLLQSKRELEAQGHLVEGFDMWHPQTEFDVFHQFSMEAGVHHAVHLYKQMGKKIALSPIYWDEPKPDTFVFGYLRDLLVRADMVMTNSHAESEKLARVFDVPLQKFHKVRNGIARDFLTDGNPDIFRERYGIKGDFLLSLANIDQRKNTHRLLAASKDLDLPVVSIGHVRDPVYFEGFRAQYPQFMQLGPVKDPAVLKSAMKACSAFVLPSLCETPGIAALEAASQGARIVITSEGPTREYFGDLVTYVNPLDVEDIRHGIQAELKATRNQYQLQKLVRESYTWTHAGFDIAEGYQKLV